MSLVSSYIKFDEFFIFILIIIPLQYTCFISYLFSKSVPSSHVNTEIFIAHHQLTVTIFIKRNYYQQCTMALRCHFPLAFFLLFFNIFFLLFSNFFPSLHHSFTYLYSFLLSFRVFLYFLSEFFLIPFGIFLKFLHHLLLRFTIFLLSFGVFLLPFRCFKLFFTLLQHFINISSMYLPK